jgi:S1-C subfamily serine protease
LRLPNGENATTLGGDGPIVEILYTGTGFVASEQGHVLTNRHVALPWLYDATARRIMGQGLQPVMQRLIGYLPGNEEPFDVEFVAASDTADVALLACQAPTTSVRPLRLATLPPDPGDEVIVMGYPTGIRALMARAGEQFVSDLSASGPIDFWQALRRLAAGGLVAPLSTRGIVGQTTQSTIVYDAATMSGGSGGPVINLDGEVVAINSAMVTGFTGSNLGVPAAEAARLLQDAARSGS